MFRIPSQCNNNSPTMNFYSAEKKKIKSINVDSKRGFTPAVMPYNFVDFDTNSIFSESHEFKKSKTPDTPRKAIKNIPEFKKSEVITKCPPGYSPIGGLNVGSQYLNCVHNITKKQIQIICPPNTSIDENGKCTPNKNGPNLAPKNAKPSKFEKEYNEKEFAIPKIFKDFPRNAHNSFRSSKKIIISEEN